MNNDIRQTDDGPCAKLARNDLGNYRWRGFEIEPLRSSYNKRHGKYVVKHKAGVFAYFADLASVRYGLPEVDGNICDNKVPSGWQKTDERVKQERDARPPEVKLASANVSVRSRLEGVAKTAEMAKKKLVEEVEKNPTYALKWASGPMKDIEAGRLITRLLETEDDQLPTAVWKTYKVYVNEMLDGLIETRSTSPFHRALIECRRDAYRSVIEKLRDCLFYYQYDGVPYRDPDDDSELAVGFTSVCV